jgi:gluconolactonase
MTPIRTFDVKNGLNAPSGYRSEQEEFLVYNSAFHGILGENCSLEVIAEKDYAFAHEAGVWIGDEIFFTSSRLAVSPESADKFIEISKINLKTHEVQVIDTRIKMGNGGTNFGDHMLICEQGNGEEHPGAITIMNSNSPYESTPLITNFKGRPFNSPNDVAILHKDKSIWFTDPTYGFAQGFKPKPVLPNQVYCLNMGSEPDLRVVADGFVRPNGICFSPDETVCYITDTGQVSGFGDIDLARPATIYSYDVTATEKPFLANKRVFAFADVGIPDGIKCDVQGNVYSGCGDGVHIWDKNGVFLGKICLGKRKCANLVFGPPGQLYILAEDRIYKASLGVSGAKK